MYVVHLTYLQPIEEIDKHLVAHRSYLDQQYAKGIFLASGPAIPRVGGIFLVRGSITRDELDAVIAQDPFNQLGLARYDVTTFTPVKHHPALADLL